MVADERSRLGLYEQLERTLGAAHADTLMSYLPSAGWADVATVQELGHTERRLDAKIDGVEQRLDAKIDGVEQRLDAKIDGVEQRLDAKIDGVEERLDAKIDGVEERLVLRMDGLRDELLAAFRHELLAQTRAIMFSSVGLALSVGGLVLAAARLA